MIKLSKFYIIFACIALCLSGCGKEETDPETEKAPVAAEESVEFR